MENQFKRRFSSSPLTAVIMLCNAPFSSQSRLARRQIGFAPKAEVALQMAVYSYVGSDQHVIKRACVFVAMCIVGGDSCRVSGHRKRSRAK